MKKRKNDIGFLLLLFYSFSSLISVFYSNVFLLFFESTSNGFSLYPFLYQYTCILICIWPLLRFDFEKQKIAFEVPKTDRVKLFTTIMFFISVIPFIENVNLLVDSNNNSKISFGMLYQMKSEGVSISRLSWLSRKLNFISVIFSTSYTILLFHYFSTVNYHRRYVLFILVLILNSILTFINESNRAGVVSILMLLITCFYFFKGSFNKTVRFQFIISFGVIVVFAFVYLSYITISRLQVSNSEFGITEWLSLYLGEGFLKFNSQLWYIKVNTNGDMVFPLFKQLLGFDTFTDVEIRDQFYFSKNGIQIENFYTFLGDLFFDFGLFLTPVLCIFFSRQLSNLLKKMSRNYLYKYLVIIISHLLLMGFTAFIYRSYNSQIVLAINLIIISIILLPEKYGRELRK